MKEEILAFFKEANGKAEIYLLSSNCCSAKDKRSVSQRNKNKVCVELVEGDEDNWLKSIEVAKTILTDIELELKHESGHPNLFKSLEATLSLEVFMRAK